MTPWEEKAGQSLDILAETARRFDPSRMAVAWSGGKDSMVLLHLIVRAWGRVPFPVLFLDTGVKFPEIYEFKERISRDWGLDMRVVKNEEAAQSIAIGKDKELCCRLLKTTPLKEAVTRYGLLALITGVRADENPSRGGETAFSPRRDPSHLRVHPILPFTEADVWDYIHVHDVPFCSLYSQGYRSLGCMPCTEKSKGNDERSGRDPEKERLMGSLRDLGYF